ncbi:hypothetical protein OAA15_00765 [bacterium]|nr:hypothetical protein [bacterium]
MKKFTVTMEVPSIQTFVYEVEAESQTQALELALEEDDSVELISHTTEEEDSFGDIQIEVEEHEED